MTRFIRVVYSGCRREITQCFRLVIGRLRSRRACLRFTNWAPVFGTVVLPVEEFSANGQQCLNRLCQPRGQAQFVSAKKVALVRLAKGRRWNGTQLEGLPDVLRRTRF